MEKNQTHHIWYPYSCIHPKLERMWDAHNQVIASVEQYVIGNTKKVYIGNSFEGKTVNISGKELSVSGWDIK